LYYGTIYGIITKDINVKWRNAINSLKELEPIVKVFDLPKRYSLLNAGASILARQRGSHVILARVGYWRTVNLQDDHGMAKPYEIDQLLEAIEDLIDQGIAAGE
jgi:hypothetical protein